MQNAVLKKKTHRTSTIYLPKTLTGIQGFDEITFGGLPKGRPTLIAGAAGCGKTLFGMEFLARGAQLYGEPGVMMSFEENAGELVKNFSSLGFDLQELIHKKKLILDHVSVERSEIEETGEYNLEGLFVRLDYSIKEINAKRVVLDTIEALFAGLANEAVLRAELRRLFRWLKSRGVTTIITGERGEISLTRHGLEEYVADCVLLLEHTVNENIATRRMRVIKYRGSAHGADEYPFLIDDTGISVLPVTSLSLDHPISTQRISSGVERLDAMLSGRGFFRGSSVLVSGTAGTGKSTIAAHFANAACGRGEKVLYFAFEEAPAQILRNMRSVGLSLEPFVKKGLLKIQAARPTLWGLELHLARIHKFITEFKPEIVVVDPISNLIAVGSENEVRSMLVRLIDFIKSRTITALFTDLIQGGHAGEATDVGVSSLMDTWILLRDIEIGGERNRGIYILKSRGMKHSNQIREFLLTEKGIDLVDVYTGPEGVLTGSAREAVEARERAEAVKRRLSRESLEEELSRKKKQLEAKMAILQAEYESEEQEIKKSIRQELALEQTIEKERISMAKSRSSEAMKNSGKTQETEAKK